MNLASLRTSFSKLEPTEQTLLIEKIRQHRIFAKEAKQKRQSKAANSVGAPARLKKAAFSLDNITPEDALKLLEMLGELNEG